MSKKEVKQVPIPLFWIDDIVVFKIGKVVRQGKVISANIGFNITGEEEVWEYLITWIDTYNRDQTDWVQEDNIYTVKPYKTIRMADINDFSGERIAVEE